MMEIQELDTTRERINIDKKCEIVKEMKGNEREMKGNEKNMKDSIVTHFAEFTNNNHGLNSTQIHEFAQKLFLNFYGKELAEQEQRYQNQIDDLTMKLAAKQQEVSDLSSNLHEARERYLRNPKEEALQIQIEDMKKQIKLKENISESIRVELEYKKNETEICKMRTERLETELNKAKETIESLQEQNDRRARECSRLRELEAKAKTLEEELRKSEVTRKDLQESLDQVENEREEELKIAQDALDEAAQEREELILTFEKELKQLNTTNTVREQQMLEDFEWKLREMEKDHKKKLDEKERQLENTLQRVKGHTDDEDLRQKIEKMRSELNSKWEDKLRSECSRLKAELDELHAEEKHLAVESMKVQKEQEIQTLKKSWELTQEEMTKKISSLKDKLTEREAYHHKELESLRAASDRDIWDLRMKLQKLDETSFDKQQFMEEKHKDEMERFRVDYEDRIKELESKLAMRDAEAGIDLIGQLEKEHKEQMQHLEEQHRLSMERLREELESDKFQAVEEARIIITKHHEYVESNLKDQLAEYKNAANQYREELESLRKAVGAERGYEPRGGSADPYGVINPSSNQGLSSSQFSLSSSTDSQGSGTSQERFYLPENTGIVESNEDGQKGGNSGLLGKVFGSGWFSPSKNNSRRGSTPCAANKKPFSQ